MDYYNYYHGLLMFNGLNEFQMLQIILFKPKFPSLGCKKTVKGCFVTFSREFNTKCYETSNLLHFTDWIGVRKGIVENQGYKGTIE